MQGAAPDLGAFESVPAPIAVGQIQSLKVGPTAFKPANLGGAIASARKKAKRRWERL